MNLPLTIASNVQESVATWFRQFAARINTIWGKEHNTDGTHSVITATSAVIGTATVTTETVTTQTVTTQTVGTQTVTTATITTADIASLTALSLAGIATGPNQPRAKVFNSGTQSINDSTLTTVTFDSEDFDNVSLHSTSSNTGRMTIPAGGDGVYLAIAKIPFAASAVGLRYIRFRKNGSNHGTQVTETPSATDVLTPEIVALVALVGGDYLEAVVFQTSGGALNIGSGAARENQSEFAITKLW